MWGGRGGLERHEACDGARTKRPNVRRAQGPANKFHDGVAWRGTRAGLFARLPNALQALTKHSSTGELPSVSLQPPCGHVSTAACGTPIAIR